MSIYTALRTVYLKLYKKGMLNFLPDTVFVPFIYRMSTGKKLNLSNPVTFNEKVQWLKLNDHNPLYVQLVDKYAVREYIAKIIGNQFLIPLIGKWSRVEDIDFEKLPNEFVLKCNHDSGGIVICKDKKTLDIKSAKKKLEDHLKRNHYYMSREWAYKNVIPCIICEKYMVDNKTQDLRDYKFFCFNGVPKFIQVDFNRFAGSVTLEGSKQESASSTSSSLSSSNCTLGSMVKFLWSISSAGQAKALCASRNSCTSTE